MSSQEARRLGFERLMGLTAAPPPEADAVRSSFLPGEGPLPLVVEPAARGGALGPWLRANRERVERDLLVHGAILFRGFGIGGPDGFHETTRDLSSDLLEYHEPSTPRTHLGGRVYTSTEYPASEWIQMHNEMSYSHAWPRKLMFYCQTPAEEGGETPIADSREVYRRLPAGLRRRFIQQGVMYVRNYGGLDLPWQDVFSTSDPRVVDERCRQSQIACTWRGDRLTTRQVRPAAAVHPVTGEPVWFNQAHAFHASALDPGLRDSLLAEMTSDDLPRNAYYGDGTAIEPEAIDEIRDVYRQVSVLFPWRRDDLLFLDNLLAAHGRAPYLGARRILVAMAELATSVALPQHD